jgi:hypothetical protein
VVTGLLRTGRPASSAGSRCTWEASTGRCGSPSHTVSDDHIQWLSHSHGACGREADTGVVEGEGEGL